MSPEDFDKIVRTVYGEAAREGVDGQRAVAAVILNRARMGNQSPTDVVLARNQFEPWGARRAELEALDPNSPAYRNVASAIQPLIAGEAADPTGGATHFYAPRAQAALGRQAPRWDDGTGSDIGNHRFFKLPYAGAPATRQGHAGDSSAPQAPMTQASAQSPSSVDFSALPDEIRERIARAVPRSEQPEGRSDNSPSLGVGSGERGEREAEAPAPSILPRMPAKRIDLRRLRAALSARPVLGV